MEGFVDLTLDDESSPAAPRPTAASKAAAVFDAMEASVSHRISKIPKIGDSDAIQVGLVITEPPATSKTIFKLRGKVYSTYPPYSQNDLLPIFVPGDILDNPTERAMVGPTWHANSCAIDTFLWISQVCNIRRTNNDAIASVESLNLLDPLSKLVVRYLRLPLATLKTSRVGFSSSGYV